jgi:hypothetical protein
MIVMTVLQSQISTMSREQLEAMVLSMKAQATRKLTLKVSEKGAVSLYGMGRFPVTLYGQQWEKLLGEAATIRVFLADNASLLSVKE